MAVNIVGAGLAGLYAALTLAEHGIGCNLISSQNSERSQSVLAAGGINAALDNMGEGDSPELHFQDTVRTGCGLADEAAVKGLTEHAPSIALRLQSLGVPFNSVNGVIQQRNFGGQRKKRTLFSKSSTGKTVMTALIGAVRKYEAQGLVVRYPHHDFDALAIRDGVCVGVRLHDTYSGEPLVFSGPVILAFGGMNGLFNGMTTGTTINTGDALASVFSQGVALSNLEMIQYHPTTLAICGKRLLVSEAACGEGGRLFIERGGKPWYFMEDKYPEFGNLMPRDVISREMYLVLNDAACGDQVYLDLTGLSPKVWDTRLSDLRKEIMEYMKIDVASVPVPVSPGIHYFMGGIDVDVHHRTNVKGLYAAGECCSQYHGANRLGGNSMPGAMYGGFVAASDIIGSVGGRSSGTGTDICSGETCPESDCAVSDRVRDILASAMGIVRTADKLEKAMTELNNLMAGNHVNTKDIARINLSKAIIMSAMIRKESRGAHYREDFPQKDDSMERLTMARFRNGEVEVGFKD